MATAMAVAVAVPEKRDCADLVVIGRIIGDDWKPLAYEPCPEGYYCPEDPLFTNELEVERVVRGAPGVLSVKGTRVQHTRLARDRIWLFALRQEAGVDWIVQSAAGSTAAEAERAWREDPIPAC